LAECASNQCVHDQACGVILTRKVACFPRHATALVTLSLAVTGIAYAESSRYDAPPSYLSTASKHLVPTITTSELAASLKSTKAPALIDSRTPGEFAISRIAGAILLDPNRNPATNFPDKSRLIVVYCSVGYRSGLVAQRMQEAGYTDVRNLAGGIFAWANEGRPLTGPHDPRGIGVHPYNEVWGRLLRRDLWRGWSGSLPEAHTSP
jgi:rhodanese-related sulfurtransferase